MRMSSVAAVIAWNESTNLAQTMDSVRQCDAVRATLAVVPPGVIAPSDGAVLSVQSLWSKQALLDMLQWFGRGGADHLLLIGSGAPVVTTDGLRRMLCCMADMQPSIVYGDYYDMHEDGSVRLHPLIDWQVGSVRDTFDFGPAFLVNGGLLNEIRTAVAEETPDVAFGGLYELRLRLTERAVACHLPEPLYRRPADNPGAQAGSHFAYVDPRNRDYQVEMETIATAHLRRIGACIDPPAEKPLDNSGTFPVTASVVIPVRNRVHTVGDAVKSALSQETGFPFNVIVVDNHSTDGTTELLADIARKDSRLTHLIPSRTDLLIGGCWNEAVYSSACGLYAVQLDSDDLYSATDVLERIVGMLSENGCALVIGSYTTVDFDLKPLPPGLIDHREWTDANGHNNALRIAGLGAPRAYHVPTLRRFGFPNVSYGEDYAAVLRLCRSYPLGRIYDSLYWCRRWEGNSDSSLPLETANRYDVFKDRLRTVEIAARIRREEC
ncbi:MAG: glycosyltransferase [Chitinivibrionales bacterium]|nr:glycosyltransferase [Chitinivibrionales bacterium]